MPRQQTSSKRINLGLAVSALSLRPGQRRTQNQLAAYCGCSKAAIYLIEKSAIHKLKKRLAYNRDPLLRELIEQILDK